MLRKPFAGSNREGEGAQSFTCTSQMREGPDATVAMLHLWCFRNRGGVIPMRKGETDSKLYQGTATVGALIIQYLGRICRHTWCLLIE